MQNDYIHTSIYEFKNNDNKKDISSSILNDILQKFDKRN